MARKNGKKAVKAVASYQHSYARQTETMLENAIRANRSDPFFAARARTHLKNGVCAPRVVDGEYHQKGMDCRYTEGYRP